MTIYKAAVWVLQQYTYSLNIFDQTTVSHSVQLHHNTFYAAI